MIRAGCSPLYDNASDKFKLTAADVLTSNVGEHLRSVRALQVRITMTSTTPIARCVAVAVHDCNARNWSAENMDWYNTSAVTYQRLWTSTSRWPVRGRSQRGSSSSC